jgi:hypothetical protein
VLVIGGAVLFVLALCAAAARTAHGRLRNALWTIAIAFVVTSPLLFIAGSYDCGDDCPTVQYAVPWLWTGLGAAALLLAVGTLVSAPIRSGRRNARS